MSVSDPDLARALARLLDEARRAQRCMSWIDDRQVIAAAPASAAVDEVVNGLAELLGCEPQLPLPVPASVLVDDDDTVRPGTGIQPRMPHVDGASGTDDEPTVRVRRTKRMVSP